MKQETLKLILTATLSALLAVSAYHFIIGPTIREIVVREEVPVRYSNFATPAEETGKHHEIAPSDFIAAAEKVTGCVVNIRTAVPSGSSDFWNKDSNGTSTGSGVIISSEGYIVTNHHVIEGGKKIEVTLNDKRSYEADMIGIDASTDLALIKIRASNLPYVKFADSDQTKIGEWVMAIGNPFNLTSTVTAGIVSAKGRNIEILEGRDAIESFIQTDAAVNPGNSGGALVNTEGDLVGINTAIITRSGRYEGYSFAVPSNLVKKVINDLREFGKVQRGYLGVDIADVNPQIADQLGLKNVEGIYVSKVRKNSGAEEAGLMAEDVITHINGVKVKTVPEMQEQVARLRPGNSISVEYIRKKENRRASIVLKDQYNLTTLSSSKETDYLAELGFELRELTASERTKLKANGVKVVSVRRGSKIDRTNMDPGYVITKVNDRKISNINELLTAFEGATGKIMLEGVYENYQGEYYYAFAK